MNNNVTKQNIIDAASLLFFQNGFNGTTVRDIAKNASVNVSLISYYFKNKQGLLEYTVTNYYEAYLKLLENTIKETDHLPHLDILKNLITRIVDYKQTHYHLTCFIQRELSLDSIFVREMTVTYIAKENYLIRRPLDLTIKRDHPYARDRHLLFVQLKGMLMAPYSSYNEQEYKISSDYSHSFFVKKYVRLIHRWLDIIILRDPVT